MRVCELESGEIYIDNVNIAHLDLHELRQLECTKFHAPHPNAPPPPYLGMAFLKIGGRGWKGSKKHGEEDV